jgi:hypothetical protein
MKPLKLEQSDTTNSNEITKTRTIRCNEQQQNRMKPLEQSDTFNSNKTENETIKTRTIRYN